LLQRQSHHVRIFDLQFAHRSLQNKRTMQCYHYYAALFMSLCFSNQTSLAAQSADDGLFSPKLQKP
jgi:hypothetical protein